MKRLGEIFTELGFSPEGDLETQKAFIRHLIQSAGPTSGLASEPKMPLTRSGVQKSKTNSASQPANSPEQLSFDSEILEGTG